MKKNAYIGKMERRIGVGFMELSEGFLGRMREKNYSCRTIYTYAIPLVCFLSYIRKGGIERIQDVDGEMIAGYRLMLASRSLKPNTVELYLRTVRMFFKHLEREGVVFDNPAAGMELPRPDRRMQPVPSVEEMERLISAIGTTTRTGIRARAAIELAYSTGMRLGELRSLDIDSIDLVNNTVRVMGKGSKERVLPMGRQATFWLEEYLKASLSIQAARDERGVAAPYGRCPPLWTTDKGKRLSMQGFQKMIESCRLKADVHTRISFHAIRRACATHMLNNGANPVELQMLLGHSGMKTLVQYLNVTITDLKRTHSKTEPGK